MHVPVLLNEVLALLDPQPNQNFVDCTINGGGHSFAILERIKPSGKVLGIDWDEEVIRQLENSDKRKEFGENLILVNDNYANLKSIVQKNDFNSVNGILLDVGFSSWHPDESGRGFTFRKDEPLDMRYNQGNPLTANEIVNKWPEEDLIKIFREYGEERWSGRIARRIILERRKKAIETTGGLAEIIKGAVPARFRFQRIHPATRVFQSLRIVVNSELENLKQGLEQAVDILKAGGRIAIISFHSLEDRLVKNFLKNKAGENIVKILTKKPIRPATQEIEQNPRSRSAKLRCAVKQNNKHQAPNNK